MRARFRPSHGTVVAYLALFVALGGTTYAATGGNFILGKSNSASTPTALSSGASQALKVTNTTAHTGVWAAGGSAANNAAAVHGQSSAGNGVEGISGKNTASGVYGQNNSTGFGVAGRSTSGTGVLGDSSGGWAFNASGNATQSRAANGFVKAMAYVNPIVYPNDPIRECFNSQRPPGTATSGNCGFTWGGASSPIIDFGFKVDDRFPSVTPVSSGYTDNAVPAGTTSVEVDTWDTRVDQYIPDPFYIFVY